MTMWQKSVFGFGSAAFGIKDGGFNAFLLIFYSQIVGVPATLVGFATMTALIIDAFIDPLIGTVSDHWRSPRGRRHPFMYASALPVALLYFALWNPPHWSASVLFFYLLGVSVALRIAVACYEIPSAALVAEISRDYDERTSILAHRALYQIIVPGVVGIITFAVFLANTKAHPNGMLNRDGYVPYAIFASAVMIASILASSFGTRKRIPYLLKIGADHRPGLAEIFRQTYGSLTNPAFMIVTLASLFGAMASGIGNALGTYFWIYFWKFSSTQITALILGALLATFFATALAPFLSRRLGKKRSGIALLLTSIVVNNITPIMKLMGLLPPDGSNALLAVFFTTTLIGVTMVIAGFVLLVSMVTDVNEDNELRTGKRSEGVFAAANSFIAKTVSGIGIFLGGVLIDFVHFPANATPQNLDPQIIRNLMLINVPLQIVLWTICIGLLGLYRIDRKVHEHNLESLRDAIALEGQLGPIADTPKLG